MLSTATSQEGWFETSSSGASGPSGSRVLCLTAMRTRTVRVEYLCTNCGTLHKTQEEGDKCCPAEEAFLCGRKTVNGQSRFHFERPDAEDCASRAHRTMTCLEQR